MFEGQKKFNRKKPDFRTRGGQLFLAQKRGMRDSEAARFVGITPVNVPNTERTRTYQACQERYGDVLKEKITLGELADEHLKNIRQDADRGAKNTAIRMAKEYIEPETSLRSLEMVSVVIKKEGETEREKEKLGEQEKKELLENELD